MGRKLSQNLIDSKDLQEKQIHQILLNNSFNWEMFVEPFGRIAFINDTVESITGYKKENWESNIDFINSIVFEDDKNAVFEHFSKPYYKDEEQGELVFRIHHKNGSVRWIHHKSKKLFDDNNHFLGYYSSNVDITHFKSPDSEKSIIQPTLSHIDGSNYLMTALINLNGDIVRVSHLFCEKLGCNYYEIINQPINNYIPQHYQSTFKSALSTAKHFDLSSAVISFKTINDDLILTDTIIHKSEMNGNVMFFITINDISQIVYSESKFNALFNANPAPMYLTLADSEKVIDANQSFELYTGFLKEEIIGKSTLDFGLFESLNTRNAGMEILKKEGKLIGYEVTIKTKMGKTKFCSFASVKIRVHNDENILTIITDLTERKKALKLLQQNEQKFRSLFNRATDGIVIHTLEGVIFDVNDTICNWLNYTTKELINQNFNQFIKDGEPKKSLENIAQLDKDEELVMELCFITKSKKELMVEMHCKNILFNNQTLILSTLHDITNRIKNEQQLRLLLAAVQQSPSSIILTDKKGDIIFANNHFCLLTGYPIEELMGQNPRIFKSNLTPKNTYTELWETLLQGNTWRGEFINKKKNGELYSEDSIISPLHNSKGEITHLIAIKNDITQTKIIDLTLRTNTANLKATIENTPDKIWSVDREIKIIIINSGFQNDFELAYGVKLNPGISCVADLPEPLQTDWINRYKRVLNGEAFSIIDRFDLPKMSIFTETSFTPILLDGEVIGASCFSRDITSLKNTEIEIKANAANLVGVIENTNDQIWSVNLRYEIIIVNSNFKTNYLAAFNVDLKSGMSCIEHLSQELKQTWKERYDRVFAGENFKLIDEFNVPNISRFFETSFTPILIDGQITGATCFTRDISEEMLLHESIRNNAEQLKTIFNSMETAILLIDTKVDTIHYSNPFAEKLMGYPNQFLWNKTLDFVKFKDLEILDSNSSTHNFGSEKVLISATGKEIPVIATISLIEFNDQTYHLLSITDISSQKHYENQIKYLNNTALSFMSINQMPKLHKYLVDELVAKLPCSFVMYGSILGNKIIPKYTHGIHSKIKEIVLSKIGHQILEKEFIIPQKLNELLIQGKLVSYPGGFNKFAKEFSPTNVVDEIEPLLNLKELKLIGLTHQSKLYGAVFIFAPSSKSFENSFLIETLLYQATIAIHRTYLEEELVLAKEEAELGNKAKSVFLANISHEIRTPMNSVIGLAEMLSQSVSDPAIKNHLKSILASNRTLLGIINDILDLSKIEEGQMTIALNPVYLPVMIQDIKHIFQLKAEQKGIEFETELSENIPSILYLDDFRLRQILINLISNAIKFTVSGSVKLIISTHIESHESVTLLLEVTDTGIGVPLDMQNQIFEAFRQQDEQDSRKYGGTGLGLSITRRLVELMNGQISLKSKVGQGSNFTVQLNQVKCSQQDSLADYTNLGDISHIEFKPYSILFLTEKPDLFLQLKKVLEGINLLVVVLSIDSDLKMSIPDIQPKVIFVDTSQPYKKPISIANELKQYLVSPSIPIVSLHDATIDKAVLSKHFDKSLSKPINSLDFVQFLMLYIPHAESLIEAQAIPVIISTSHLNLKELQAYNDESLLLLRQWEIIRKKNSMSEVENFAIETLKTGKSYNIPQLIEYGKELLMYVESFDIEEMTLILKKFPLIIQGSNKTRKP